MLTLPCVTRTNISIDAMEGCSWGGGRLWGFDAGGVGFAFPAVGAQARLMGLCASESPAPEHTDAARTAFCARGLRG